jgi:ABC-type Fe3+/spermidine/putrescine transport system ATPase subunit
MPSTMRVQHLSKRFGEMLAVDGFDLQSRESELIALLGPSGCGKTTTLRMIAGFEQPTSGSILVNDRDITALPPEKRNAGMVFQSYALFPHMTVAENIGFGLQMRRVSREETRSRVGRVIERVGLAGMEGRYPRQLSGGQQQRTALARALVIGPDMLLLDEPLANLDANLREEMRIYIREIQQEFGITTIYVTHDQVEALAMADRIGVMIAGKLQQVDVPDVVYRRAANVPVARFLGVANFIEGKVLGESGDRVKVETALGTFVCAADRPPVAGERGVIAVRPSDLVVGAAAGDLNHLRGTLQSKAFLGSYFECQIRVHDALVLRGHAAPDFAGAPGQMVTASFADRNCWLMEAA